ncbi:MAG: SpoIIE family protein phosphatase [Acidobacteriales bacterium]|nr:SpoIIE family protein phosphatase [Terriglobales bacterium]
MMDWRRNRMLWLVLLGMLAASLTYQVRLTKDVLEFLFWPAEQVNEPFRMQNFSPVIEEPAPEAIAAGLRRQDVIVAVNGLPLSGSAVLFTELNRARTGDDLKVRVRHAGQSQETEHTIHLKMAVARWPAETERMLFGVVLGLAMPWLCLVVGYWVAFLRPRDRLAWFLLGLMLGFSTLIRFGNLAGWQDWIRPLALAYRAVTNGCWGISMLLFGLYFPEPFSFERRFWWIKWTLICPLLLFAGCDTYLVVAAAHDYTLAAPLQHLIRPYRPLVLILLLCSICVFLIAMFLKRRMAQTSDARRRLNLLYFGTASAIMPALALAVYALLRGPRAIQRMPGWLQLPPFLLLILFPLTLAYVILVERAMDVRLVIRQGLRYTLARHGVRVLQTLISIGVAISAVALALDPVTNRVEEIATIVFGVALIILVRFFAERVGLWLDRKFFREAYNAEHILSQLSEDVRTMVEAGPVLQTVARRISDSLHATHVAFLTLSNGSYKPVYALGFDHSPEVTFPTGGELITELRRRNEPLRVYYDDPDSWIYREDGLDEEDRTRLRRLDAQLLLPLSIKDRLLGFIVLGPKKAEAPYSRLDLQLLRSVASQTALALENSHLTEAVAAEVAKRERLNRELEIAREVQQRLFPQNPPEISGLEYDGYCRPAEGVAGDYYDFFALPDGRLGFAIGDVSGKGVPASLLMASLQASLRGLAINGSNDLAGLMGNLNRLTYDTTAASRYATLLYAEYEPATRQFAYVNAGHNPPLLLRGADVVRLTTGGPVIGALPDLTYAQGNLVLEPGDILVGYTDGITEARNPGEEEWGEERLAELTRACAHLSAREMIQRILESVDTFAAGTPQYDDMTLVVLKLPA